MKTKGFGEHRRIADLVGRLGRTAHCLQFTDGLNPAQWEALRYLARANRYSLSPSALAEFLGTTKGTASQTVRALENKGLVRRAPNGRDRRSVTLELTEAGAALLRRDPMAGFERASRSLPGDRLAAVVDGLSRLLRDVQDGCGGRPFGVCQECGHFRPLAAADEPKGPHRCGLVGDPLSESDSALICVSFAPVTR
ncbi:MAG: MarR family winged helix-turn-helix transcriptional regulator [Alphaproteobacteria bacterium]